MKQKLLTLVLRFWRLAALSLLVSTAALATSWVVMSDILTVPPVHAQELPQGFRNLPPQPNLLPGLTGNPQNSAPSGSTDFVPILSADPLTDILLHIANVTGAQNAFWGKTFSPSDEGINLSAHGGYVGKDNSGLGHAYDGNTWLSLKPGAQLHEINSDGSLANGGYTASGDTVTNVRWVLTEVENQTKTVDTSIGAALSGTNCLGNIYIFRNEYNPALMIGFDFINGSISCAGPAAPNGDQSHFVYYQGCEGSFSKGAGYISDLGDAPDRNGLLQDGGLTATDQDSTDSIRKGLNWPVHQKNVKICTNDMGLTGQALRSAMNTVSNIVGDIFDWIKGALLNVVNVGSLSGNRGLVNAWKTIRDFVNIIFILVLGAIAFSSIIRLDTERYGIRSLLPRLVFAVIAVNFSFLMVQILTNIAYIISQPFLSKAFALLSNPPANGSIIDPSQGIGQFFIALLLVLAVIIGFVILFFFFVIRILVIWLLAALSPLVFLFMILPLTRSLSSSWWKNALKWIFMAPIAFVLLFIAAELLATSGTNDNINGPDFALKIAFFVAACIAAVRIPFILGGEIMGRAAKAAGFGAKRLPGARTAMAYAAQRQANREQGAKLRAAGIQGRISRGLSRVPGGRAAAAVLTGGRAGMIGAQQAGIEGKYAKDIQDMNLGVDAQRMVMAGNTGALRATGNHRAANLANTAAGRRAAGRLLAQNGLLTRELFDDLPGRRRREQRQAGNLALMRNVDPVLGTMNQQGQWTDEAIDRIGGQVGSLEATDSKGLYWSHILQAGERPRHASERRASHTAFESITDAQAAGNVDTGNMRTLISNSGERRAFIEGLTGAHRRVQGLAANDERRIRVERSFNAMQRQLANNALPLDQRQGPIPPQPPPRPRR